MIAVSFCNAGRKDSLAILNDSFEVIEKVNLGISTTGIVKTKGGFFVVSDGINIYKISDNYEVVNMFRTGLRDIHSILEWDGYLYLVGTYNDSIGRIKVENGNLVSDKTELFFTKGFGTDKFHINSIEVFRNQLIFSNFGESGSNKKDATNGGVEILNGPSVITGIQHPHSLKVKDLDLYFLESKTSTLYKNLKPQFSLTGYLRGFDKQRGDYLIGFSKSRNVDSVEGAAKLLRTNEKGVILDMVEFEEFEEIYDVITF